MAKMSFEKEAIAIKMIAARQMCQLSIV